MVFEVQALHGLTGLRTRPGSPWGCCSFFSASCIQMYAVTASAACVGRFAHPSELPLELVQLPPGFSISLYVNDSVPNARALTVSRGHPSGGTIVYASSQSAGQVTDSLAQPLPFAATRAGPQLCTPPRSLQAR